MEGLEQWRFQHRGLSVTARRFGIHCVFSLVLWSIWHIDFPHIVATLAVVCMVCNFSQGVTVVCRHCTRGDLLGHYLTKICQGILHRHGLFSGQ